MKKLQKIKLDELAGIELNEKGLCRILGGGTPGNCQCGCLYADAGGAESADNDAANSAGGQYSTTCPPEPERPTPHYLKTCEILIHPQDALCHDHGGGFY